MSTFNRTRVISLIVGLLVLAGVAAWVASPALILSALPYLPFLLLFLACPLAMMFMMGGMGHVHMGDNAEHQHSTSEEMPDLAGLPREEQVRALRQQLARMAWQQEALRHDLEQLEAEQRAEHPAL